MSNTAGAFSSVLMSLPLIAVPCLAVFGLPSIGPATAGADTEETVELAIDSDLGQASSSLGAAAESAAFPPIVDAGSSASESNATPFQPASSEQSEFERTSGHREAAANTAVGLNESTDAHKEFPLPSGPSGERSVAMDFGEGAGIVKHQQPPSDAGSARTWEEVLAQLNQLGIRGFHLTNSDVPGKFYFSCNMSEDGQNVTRRFEAEATTPVAAAEDVLGQVQACMVTR